MKRTFIYYKEIKRIEATDISITKIYLRDGSIYISLFPIQFNFDYIDGFFTPEELKELKN